MSDIALRLDPGDFAADLAVEGNDLARDQGLRTAVLLSLFTDRRADAGDVLPPGEADRRGWWADAVPVVGGDRIGSRLWLIAREKATTSSVIRAEAYAREALQWLIEDRVTDRVDVVASMPRAGVLALEVAIYRPRADPVRFRFNHVWDGVEAPPVVDDVPLFDFGDFGFGELPIELGNNP